MYPQAWVAPSHSVATLLRARVQAKHEHLFAYLPGMDSKPVSAFMEEDARHAVDFARE